MTKDRTYTIRDARPDEMDTVAELLLEAYEQYQPAMPAGAWEGYARNLVDVRGRAADCQLIVAEWGGRIVGTVTFFPEGEKGEGWPAGYTAVRLLGVDPQARGAGIGRALMEECLRRSRALGAKHVGLHTTELMTVAREMYVRMGFERAPEHDFRPAPGILVMAYRLELEDGEAG